MNQIFEFVSNNLLLFAAFAATLGMLLFTEYQRLFSGVKPVSPLAATRLLNDGEAVFVDVRTEGQYKQGHVLNARSLPGSAIEQRWQEIEKFKDKAVVVYCDTGMQANKAGSRLKKHGFDQVHTLAGGLAAWEKANLPVVSK